MMRAVRAVLRRLGALLRLSFLGAAAFALAATGYRLLKLTRTDRIGHLVGEIDCALKEEKLGRWPRRRAVLLAPRDRVANRHVVDYWRRYLEVVESPFACSLLGLLEQFEIVRYRRDMRRYFIAINETAEYNSIYREWGERPPLLTLSDADRARGMAALLELGLPANARFICFHSRDGAYSPNDEHWHRFRNAPIETYLSAASAIHDRGLFSIRMGDPSMPRMSATPGAIDYAHSSLRAEWLDVFLCARCEFFLGNTSGLYLISTAFGRPSALANLVPVSMALSGGPRELGIPKLLWHEKAARYLTYPEIFALPLADYRFADLYHAEGIRPVDNEPQDIRDLALEMLDRVDGVTTYDAEDEALQQMYRSLYRPGNYGCGSSARVGRAFLHRHAHLLER